MPRGNDSYFFMIFGARTWVWESPKVTFGPQKSLRTSRNGVADAEGVRETTRKSRGEASVQDPSAMRSKSTSQLDRLGPHPAHRPLPPNTLEDTISDQPTSFRPTRRTRGRRIWAGVDGAGAGKWDIREGCAHCRRPQGKVAVG